jgi:hypothetical protein
MKPGHKIVMLAFALIAPYVAVVILLIARYPPNNIPEWIPLVGGCYMLATILLLGVCGKRIAGRSRTPVQPSRTSERMWVTVGMLFITYLLVLWSCFFVYGTFEFFKGEIPTSRAVPAGTLLLAFMLTLGWPTFRYWKLRLTRKSRQQN